MADTLVSELTGATAGLPGGIALQSGDIRDEEEALIPPAAGLHALAGSKRSVSAPVLGQLPGGEAGALSGQISILNPAAVAGISGSDRIEVAVNGGGVRLSAGAQKNNRSDKEWLCSHSVSCTRAAYSNRASAEPAPRPAVM